MFMKNSFKIISFLNLILITIFLASCASHTETKRVSGKDQPPQTASLHSSSDARTDTSLGTIGKGKTEAEKQAASLQEKSDADEVLLEIKEREAQEELQRIQKSIVEFDKTEEQFRLQQ